MARGAAVVALGMLALLPGLAFAGPPPSPPDVPQAIVVTDGSVPFLLLHATGTQNYVCRSSGDNFLWTFVGPSATLYDEKGKDFGTHFGGPTWLAKDGSSVIGALVARSDVPGAIPWLLLRAAWTAVGPDGDRLAATTNIQRVNTTGGVMPTSGCDAANLEAEAKVPYTADYYFYRAQD